MGGWEVTGGLARPGLAWPGQARPAFLDAPGPPSYRRRPDRTQGSPSHRSPSHAVWCGRFGACRQELTEGLEVAKCGSPESASPAALQQK